TTWVSISTGMASIPRVVALQTRIIGGVSWPGFYYRHLAPPKRNSSREDYEITSSFRISTASRSNSTGPLKRLFVGPFSRRRTPRGQTVAHIPQPTQEARMTFCPRCAYHRTSIPISQYVEQFPQEMHCPPFVVMRKREKKRCCRPRIAAIGHPNRHQTRAPING